MSERSNFHEDDLKHYWLKAQNARSDGKPVGCEPRKKASKASIRHVLETAERLDAHTRSRLEAMVGGPKKKSPLDALLDSMAPDTRAVMIAILNDH